MSAPGNDTARFDYARAKARVADSTRRSEESLDAVFSRRAAELAMVPAEDRASGAPHLVFEVSGTRFAVAQDDVHLVLRAPSLDAVPFAPSVVDRMLLVQGHFVSVYDLALRAGRPRSAGQVVIVLRGAGRLAIRADAVLGLGEIDASTLIRPRDDGGALDPILFGITSEQVQVIDVTRLNSKDPQ